MSSPNPNNPPIRRKTIPQDQRITYIKQKQNPYLSRIPFWRKYQKSLTVAGSIVVFCIVYSAPLYQFFRTPPENINPLDTMWPGEKMRGKTYKEQFIERQQKMKEEKERFMAEMAAKSATK